MKFLHHPLHALDDAERNFEQIEQAGLYAGTGAPVFQANNGDYYFRKDTPSVPNQRLYVCEGGGVWVNALAGNNPPYVDITQEFGVSTGATDNSAAINTALSTLGPEGLIGWLPPGTYAVQNQLAIGNGTSIANSTWSARLAGSGCVDQWASFTTNPTIIQWTGSAGTDMVHVNGPLVGWGLERLTLDGNALASLNMRVRSAQHGYCHDLSFQGANSCVVEDTPNLTANTMHNVWDHIDFTWRGGTARFPHSYNGAIAFLGSGGNANCCYDDLRHVSSLAPSTSSGQLHTVFYFGDSDNVRIRHVHCYMGTGTDIPRGIVFDYGSGQPGHPADDLVDTVDWGYSANPYTHFGTPSGASPNRVSNVSATNGYHNFTPGEPNFMYNSGLENGGATAVTAAANTIFGIAHGLPCTPYEVLGTPLGWQGDLTTYTPDGGSVYFSSSIALAGNFISWHAKG